MRASFGLQPFLLHPLRPRRCRIARTPHPPATHDAVVATTSANIESAQTAPPSRPSPLRGPCLRLSLLHRRHPDRQLQPASPVGRVHPRRPLRQCPLQLSPRHTLDCSSACSALRAAHFRALRRQYTKLSHRNQNSGRHRYLVTISRNLAEIVGLKVKTWTHRIRATEKDFDKTKALRFNVSVT